MGHQFVRAPPMERHGLTFCQQFKGLTCCNSTHTTTILREAYPYLTEDHFSDNCRHEALNALCAPCDPFVGTGKHLVCKHICQRWFLACRQDPFTVDKHGLKVIPCSGDSLVCSPLHQIVSNGRQLCEAVGFGVADPPYVRKAAKDDRTVQALVAELDELLAPDKAGDAATKGCYTGKANPAAFRAATGQAPPPRRNAASAVFQKFATDVAKQWSGTGLKALLTVALVIAAIVGVRKWRAAKLREARTARTHDATVSAIHSARLKKFDPHT